MMETKINTLPLEVFTMILTPLSQRSHRSQPHIASPPVCGLHSTLQNHQFESEPKKFRSPPETRVIQTSRNMFEQSHTMAGDCSI